jgi:hypothetical protein
MPVRWAGAGSRPGGRGTFLCVAKETYPKERRPRCPCPHSPGGEWGSLRCSVLGCTAELAAFFELRSNNRGESVHDARVLRHALTPGPALLGTVRRGWIPTRAIASLGRVVLRCARLASAIAQRVGSAQRVTDTRRSCEAAAVPDPAPPPAGCAEKRRSWGGRVCRRTHTLRRLACRSCLSGVRRTQRVLRHHPRSEHRRLPAAKRRDADWGPPSLW